ncbi:MAG: hypothetical protein KF805_10040 [Phycisphaeraceae bacterium]|nr:hypothetical protein [Phycisphaeraceae bacterium]
MFSRLNLPLLTAASLVSLAAAPANSQVFNAQFEAPSLDRWMYPFNFSAGAEFRASLFAAPNEPGFDDRDGEMLVGFDTAATVPAGQGRLRYKILNATLTVFVENDLAFRYDPTPDPLASSYPTSDPDYIPDSDPSKPIEVWAVGYRNGFSSATFAEDSTFGGTPLVQPAEAARNAFPATLDNAQVATDVARQVRQKLAASPLALARLFDDSATELTPGTLVPQGTAVRFDLGTTSSANYVYLQNALETGRLRLLVTTLEPTSGGPGGGTGGVTYPRIYTKENPAAALGYAPSLDLQIAVTCDADFTGDNVVDDADFVIFVNAYNELLDARCDLNGDTVTDDADFVLFVAAYDTLLCD